MKKVFLTGATGVVGSSVLKKILLETDASVIALMRGESPKQRLQKLFDFLKLDFSVFEKRIEVVNAAAETPFFGLDSSAFKAFANSLDVVFHCAANVELTQSAEHAKMTAVAAIGNIIGILKINPNCKFEHVSTVGVNGSANEGLPEKRIQIDRPFFNSYEMSKAFVENQLYPLIDQGYAITIHRPSMVVGDENSGRILHFQIFYFLLRVISGEVTYGLLPPILDRKLDTIPCNFVAEVLVRSAQTPSWKGRIIHQCSGPSAALTLGQIQEIVQKEKLKLSLPVKGIRQVPLAFFSMLSCVGKVLPLQEKWKTRIELLPQLLNYAQQDQIFYNSESMQLLGGEGWPLPQSYLHHSIRYYLEQRQKKNNNLGET